MDTYLNENKTNYFKTHCLWLDVARGIAIILVVLGHSIQTNILAFDNSRTFKIIYSFHMPLFMFIAGIAACFSLNKNPQQTINEFEYLKRRFFSLIIPFIVWIFVPYIFFYHIFPLNELKDRIISIFISPDNGLWFLYVLFVINCFVFVIYRINIKYKIPMSVLAFCTWFLLDAIIRYMHFNYLGIGLVRNHFRYFMAGYIFFSFHRKRGVNYKNLEIIILSLLSIIFIFTVQYWNRVKEPSFLVYSYIENLNHYQRNILLWVYKTFLPYCGISLIILLSIIIINLKSSFLLYCFETLGSHTIEIYTMHCYCFSFIDNIVNKRLHIIIDATIALIYSLVIAFCLKGSFLYRIFYGRK